MNAAKQAGWLFCLLLAITCTSLFFASPKSIKRLDADQLLSTADLIISNLNVSRYDESGKLINYLETPQVKHIPAAETHFLDSPHLSIKQSEQPAWEISSKYAKSVHAGEQITFIQDVVVHQAKTKNGQESTMKTEELDYFSKSKIARTQRTVRFEQAGSVVHSLGMIAYLEDKRIKLSHAKAMIEPKHA